MRFPSQCLQPLGLMGDEAGTVSRGTWSMYPADEGPNLGSVGAARLSGMVHCSHSGMGAGVGVGGESPTPSELGWAPRCWAALPALTP